MPTGRPLKLEPAVMERLLQAVRDGNTRRASARAAGICRATFQRWISEGKRQRKGKFRDFLDQLRGAEAEAELQLLAGIRAAGVEHGRWQALAWILSRRNPADWGDHKHAIQQILKEQKEIQRALDALRPPDPEP
jgi:hypothetical protein